MKISNINLFQHKCNSVFIENRYIFNVEAHKQAETIAPKTETDETIKKLEDWKSKKEDIAQTKIEIQGKPLEKIKAMKSLLVNKDGKLNELHPDQIKQIVQTFKSIENKPIPQSKLIEIKQLVDQAMNVCDYSRNEVELNAEALLSSIEASKRNIQIFQSFFKMNIPIVEVAKVFRKWGADLATLKPGESPQSAKKGPFNPSISLRLPGTQFKPQVIQRAMKAIKLIFQDKAAMREFQTNVIRKFVREDDTFRRRPETNRFKRICLEKHTTLLKDNTATLNLIKDTYKKRSTFSKAKTILSSISKNIDSKIKTKEVKSEHTSIKAIKEYISKPRSNIRYSQLVKHINNLSKALKAGNISNEDIKAVIPAIQGKVAEKRLYYRNIAQRDKSAKRRANAQKWLDRYFVFNETFTDKLK